jgi:predicted transposase YbfD/YdcC
MACLQWPCIEMHTHCQSQVESNQTHKYEAETIWLAYSGRVQKRIHTVRVKSSWVQSDSQICSRDYLVCLQWPCTEMHTHWQSQVESSPLPLAKSSILMPHASFLSVRLQWSGTMAAILQWEMNAKRLTLYLRTTGQIYNASHCEHRDRNHTASIL